MIYIIICALFVFNVNGYNVEANNRTNGQVTEVYEKITIKEEYELTNKAMNMTKLKANLKYRHVKKRGDDEVDDLIAAGENLSNEDYYDKKYWSNEDRAIEDLQSAPKRRLNPESVPQTRSAPEIDDSDKYKLNSNKTNVTSQIDTAIQVMKTRVGKPKYPRFDKYDNEIYGSLLDMIRF